MAALLTSFREGCLAFATGAGAGGAASFIVLRAVRQRAQTLGDSADERIVKLRTLHGTSDDRIHIAVRPTPKL